MQLDEMVSTKGKSLRTMALKLEKQIASTDDQMKKRDLRVRWHNAVAAASQHDIVSIRKAASKLPPEKRTKHQKMINDLEAHTMKHNDEAMKLMRMKGPKKEMTEELNESGPQFGRMQRNLKAVEGHKAKADAESNNVAKHRHLANMHLSHTAALSAERKAISTYVKSHPEHQSKYSDRLKSIEKEQEHHDNKYLHHAKLSAENF